MNTPNRTPAEFPPPIVNDVYLPASTGETERRNKEDGTRIDLITGECRIARLIRGILYDTGCSALVVSVTSTDVANGFNLRRLYRTGTGHWFAVHFSWWNHLFVIADDFIWPLPEDGVLGIAMSLVPDKDCLRFILDWYSAGLVPRDDRLAECWATQVLSEEDLEAALASIASLPPESQGQNG